MIAIRNGQLAIPPEFVRAFSADPYSGTLLTKSKNWPDYCKGEPALEDATLEIDPASNG